MKFKLSRPDYELNEQELTVEPIHSKKGKQEIMIKLGRFGHLAMYSQHDNSIYIFAG